jgi:hypothetical protein
MTPNEANAPANTDIFPRNGLIREANGCCDLLA